MVTNNFENKNFMQLMGRLNVHLKCLDFFSFKFWEGRRIFFHFSFVPNMFPSSSQYVSHVLNVFHKGVPNNTLFYSHMFYPKSSPSHLYRWAKGGGFLSFFLCSRHVPCKFPMGSHQVFNMFPRFPMCSQ
jgi:hypothetical protein